jgi:hypothetical protein
MIKDSPAEEGMRNNQEGKKKEKCHHLNLLHKGKYLKKEN